MSERQCPHCGRRITVDGSATFCPYCGGALGPAALDPQADAVQAALARVEAQANPVKKHELLEAALREFPDSLAVAEEVLFLGRLHERSKRTLDFSVIKSYLLNLYLEPETLTAEKRDAMRRELFDHPDLDRCLKLAGDEDVFMAHYLHRLSGQFIQLFLHGSSKYMRRFFGFGMDSRAPKLLASPAAKMLAGMQADAALTDRQRSMLMRAFFDAFCEHLGGETRWLEEAMAERPIVLA
jgi:hypothetical protein